MNKKIVGIVGSYRKECTIDSMVTEILNEAEKHGAQTHKIYLLDEKIEFCTNCRTCTQAEGPDRGKCVHDDDMEKILGEIEGADAIVIGAPVNFFNISALARRFMERLVCYTYWPWGQMGPKMRPHKKKRKAVLVTSSAMPGIMGRVFTGAMRALNIMAKTLGAKPVAKIFLGFAAGSEKKKLSSGALRKARNAANKLVS